MGTSSLSSPSGRESAHIKTATTGAKKEIPMTIGVITERVRQLGFPDCADRILFLKDTDDMEEGEQPLQLESAQGFLSFFTRFGDLGEPLLGLFPQGTLSVGWRIAENKHLLIEPLDSRRVSFALITPSNSPDEKFRLSGKGLIEDVIRTLRKHKIDQWRHS